MVGASPRHQIPPPNPAHHSFHWERQAGM